MPEAKKRIGEDAAHSGRWRNCPAMAQSSLPPVSVASESAASSFRPDAPGRGIQAVLADVWPATRWDGMIGRDAT